MTINSSKFEDNIALNGAAINITGINATLTISKSCFSGNSTVVDPQEDPIAPLFYNGGAIRIEKA